MSTAIAKTEPLPIQTMTDLEAAGELLAQSGMFGAKNKAEGFVIVSTCQQQRISLIDFIRTYHLVENKPSMRADAMAAEFRKRGGKYTILQRDPECAKAEFEFEGNKQTFFYSMEIAKRQNVCFSKDGTLKANWQNIPENMLWARMMSNAVRVLCPEINSGVYTPEEIQDFSSNEIKPVNSKQEKVIDPVEAAKVINPEPVKAVNPEPNPEPTKPEVENFQICPLDGVMKGENWANMDDNTLNQALAVNHDSMKPEHYATITRILEYRKKAK